MHASVLCFMAALGTSALCGCATPALRTVSTIQVVIQPTAVPTTQPTLDVIPQSRAPVVRNETPAVSSGQITLPLPTGSTVHVVGMTNSGWWPQQIIVQANNEAPVSWVGTGSQINNVVGSLTLPAVQSGQPSVTVQMFHDPGAGMAPSTIRWVPYSMPGLAGYVVGGQDASGRPNGPAFWNTTVFVYWSTGY